jgi:hypothetical protein
MYRTAAWSFVLGTAAVAGGAYLYTVYGPRKHRKPVALATGLLVGQQIGAAAGLALGGPIGVLPGSVTGGIAGAILGNECGAQAEGAE